MMPLVGVRQLSPAGISGATWQWDGKHWAQCGDFGPAPRTALATAYDSARARMVLFGGQDAQGRYGDT